MPVCDHDADDLLAEPLHPVRQPINLIVGDGRVDQDRVAFAGDERTAQPTTSAGSRRAERPRSRSRASARHEH